MTDCTTPCADTYTVTHATARLDSFIHSFTYLLGLRAKEATWARVSRACATRVLALRCSALSVCVCVLWCMWSFSARGAKARLSPLAEASRKLNPCCFVH